MEKTKLSKMILIFLAVCLLAGGYSSYLVFKYAGAGLGVAAFAIIAVLCIATFFLSRKTEKTALVIAIILAVLLIISSALAMKLNSKISKVNMTGEYETVQIVALKGSDIDENSDISGVNMGYVNTDAGAYQKGSEILKEHDKKVFKSVPYATTKETYNSFLTGNEKLMVLTNFTKSDLSDIDEEYEDKVKVIFEKKYPVESVTLKPVDISKEPFTLYLCGADLSSHDNINSTGRGDVNILLTVNPKTKKVNMQTIPRDTFVNIPCAGGRSKLSYSGWWGGVQSSIESIEEKFGIEINYYAKLNFNGLTQLVDALGGVEVYSHYTYTAGKHSFVEGKNFVDGEKALKFARARKMLPQNELSRGQHQMELIKGIFRKFGENPTYDNAMSVIDAMSNNFATNLPEKDYLKAFNLVVDLLPELQTMENHSIKGEYKWHTDEVRPTEYKYYYYPAEGEVERVRNDIQKILDGK